MNKIGLLQSPPKLKNETFKLTIDDFSFWTNDKATDGDERKYGDYTCKDPPVTKRKNFKR